MKKFVGNIQTLVILVLVILVLLKTCGGLGSSDPIEKVITKVEVRYDTLEVEKRVFVPKVKTVIRTNTITDTVFKKYKIDTLAILKDYYSAQGKYYGVDGVGSIEEITQRLSTVLDKL